MSGVDPGMTMVRCVVLLSTGLWCLVGTSWAQSPAVWEYAETGTVTPIAARLQVDLSSIETSPGEVGSLPARFNWKGTLLQSGLLLGTQHSLRMVQEKTRAHLGGPFWRDYLTSVSGLSGWNDGNPVITNYVGHPMMGAVTGFIQIHNDPRGVALEWDPQNPGYWKSRFKALGWATAYSTSYEIAPWGEAGIGNVGYDRGTMGYVDLVVTPLGGFGMLLLEDYLDRHVIKRLERGKRVRQARILRFVLNPQRSIANVLRFERPSFRDTRADPE